MIPSSFLSLFRDLHFQGPEKAIRGGECEPIKIPRRNLAYVSKSTRCTSLLTRSRLRSYRQATSPRNRVRKPQITAKTRIDAGKNTCKIMAIKIGQTISSSPHRHFIEHLTGVFGKPHRESTCSRNQSEKITSSDLEM
jgi:hypothetical protein